MKSMNTARKFDDIVLNLVPVETGAPTAADIRAAARSPNVMQAVINAVASDPATLREIIGAAMANPKLLQAVKQLSGETGGAETDGPLDWIFRLFKNPDEIAREERQRAVDKKYHDMNILRGVSDAEWRETQQKVAEDVTRELGKLRDKQDGVSPLPAPKPPPLVLVPETNGPLETGDIGRPGRMNHAAHVLAEPRESSDENWLAVVPMGTAVVVYDIAYGPPEARDAAPRQYARISFASPRGPGGRPTRKNAPPTNEPIQGWVQAETVTYDVYDAPSRDTGEILGGESEYIWERPAWRDRLRGLYGERFWAHPEWRRRWYEMAGLPDTGDAGFAGTDAGWWRDRLRGLYGERFWAHPEWRRRWYDMMGLADR
jgi:hypothetical protein